MRNPIDKLLYKRTTSYNISPGPDGESVVHSKSVCTVPRFGNVRPLDVALRVARAAAVLLVLFSAVMRLSAA